MGLLTRTKRSAVLATIAAVMLAMSSSKLAHAEEKIKIGVPLPLSGGGAVYGEDIRDFLEFAHRDLANERYQLVFEDDACSPKTSVTAAQRLLRVEKVRYAIGFACSGTVLSPAKLYRDAGVPIVVVFASSPKIRSLDHVFRTYPSDAQAAQLLAQAIVKNHQHIAILSEQTDYAQDLKDAVVQELKPSGVAVLTVDYLPDTADFRTLLTRMRASKVDALFINPQVEGTFSLITKQLRELGWSPSLFGAYWPASPAVLAELGTQLDGTIFVDTPSLVSLLDEDGREVFNRYRQQGGVVRSTEAVFASTYEGFRALHQALESKQDVAQHLANNQWNGLFGPWRFDEAGEIDGLALELKEVHEGKPRALKNP